MFKGMYSSVTSPSNASSSSFIFREFLGVELRLEKMLLIFCCFLAICATGLIFFLVFCTQAAECLLIFVEHKSSWA